MSLVHPQASAIAVREEVGHAGVRHQLARGSAIPVASPTNINSRPATLSFGGTMAVSADQVQAADRLQRQSTHRSHAPGAAYPNQARPGEPFREERPKNHQDFSLIGRDIGLSGVADTIGGYAAAAAGARVELTENLTQRTLDDLTHEYYNPTGPFRFERGSHANQFFQHRMEYRDVDYKNAPGRAPGAFQHEIKRPGHPQEELWRSGTQGYAPRATMKNDVAIVHRQRADEAPNREGLRMQYSDVYASGFEQLENPRRMQHTVTSDTDHSLLLAYNTCPYTQPLGIVPPRD